VDAAFGVYQTITGRKRLYPAKQGKSLKNLEFSDIIFKFALKKENIAHE
jgi:hypothetical protein